MASVLLTAWSMQSANAGLVVADFNDLATGALDGQSGGTGFDDSTNWWGTGTIDVESGDLTSSLYNITQTGTPRRVKGDFNTTRHIHRDLGSSLTNEIWFSFLANNPVNDSTAGITFNAPDNGGTVPPNGIWFQGTNLNVRINDSGNIAAYGVPLGETALVVGQMVVGPGSDTLKVWVNPDLKADSVIAHHTPFFTSTTVDFFDSLDRVGVITYAVSGEAGSADGGLVDCVRVSNLSTAFYDVTGVNKPPQGTLIIIR